MQVSVVKTMAEYPMAPFHPSERYPEYPYSAGEISQCRNAVYEAVRNALYMLGFDRENHGTRQWNPLGQFVAEGGKVVIKPNFVNHWNPLSDERSYFEALVTHGSVIRALIDYVHIATNGIFTVTIADLPIQTADLSVIVERTGLDRVIEFVRKSSGGKGTVRMIDLRDYQVMSDRSGAMWGKKKQPGDTLGYVAVDLGRHSNLVALEESGHLFRSLDYEKSTTVRRHSNGAHEYIFSRTMLECDFLLNVPKLKVHRKTGVTLSLKNIVGTIGDKSCLPHYREGGPKSGGDEYPIPSVINALRGQYSFPLRRLGRTSWKMIRPFGLTLLKLNRAFHKDRDLINITGGDWYGNDTIWRMVHDINCAIFHADMDGKLNDCVQRKYLTVVDGIIGGEGEGPLSPNPVSSGMIVAGTDPLAVDICCTRLMGMDWRKIPLYARYNPNQRYRFSNFDGDTQRIDVRIFENGDITKRRLVDLSAANNFEPAPGWKNHIEF